MVLSVSLQCSIVQVLLCHLRLWWCVFTYGCRNVAYRIVYLPYCWEVRFASCTELY